MLTHNVSILPSESFEVSTQPVELFQPENPAMIYIPNSGHFYGIKIYVRMKAGLEVGNYNELIAVTSEDADTVFVSVSGTVTGDAPTPPIPPTPSEGNYVRISDVSALTAGSYIIIAARFDENTADYYARVYRTLKANGTPIPQNDIWIAAAVLETAGILCTDDRHLLSLPLVRTIRYR